MTFWCFALMVLIWWFWFWIIWCLVMLLIGWVGCLGVLRLIWVWFWLWFLEFVFELYNQEFCWIWYFGVVSCFLFFILWFGVYLWFCLFIGFSVLVVLVFGNCGVLVFWWLCVRFWCLNWCGAGFPGILVFSGIFCLGVFEFGCFDSLILLFCLLYMGLLTLVFSNFKVIWVFWWFEFGWGVWGCYKIWI